MCAVVLSVVLQPVSVYADAASDRAQTYCDGQNIADADQKEMCTFGYKKGYEKARGGVCFGHVKSLMKSKYHVNLNTVPQIKANSIAKQLYSKCSDGKKNGKIQRDADDAAKDNAAANAEHKCSGIPTFFEFGCDAAGSNKEKSGNESPISQILFTILSWLTGLVTLAAIGGIIYGGILYSSAGGNASQTQKGISFVLNAVIGLLLWIGTYAIINFIVPGGLFR